MSSQIKTLIHIGQWSSDQALHNAAKFSSRVKVNSGHDPIIKCYTCHNNIPVSHNHIQLPSSDDEIHQCWLTNVQQKLKLPY